MARRYMFLLYLNRVRISLINVCFSGEVRRQQLSDMRNLMEQSKSPIANVRKLDLNIIKPLNVIPINKNFNPLVQEPNTVNNSGLGS